MKIPFSPPDIGEEEIKEVSETLKSGWITTGPRTKELERRVAEYVGVEKCVCLNSQSACAEMALRLIGLQPGDEVITSAYTYTATAEVVCHIPGVKLVLVDTRKDSIQMDYDSLEQKITTHTKVIIPVDLAGIPCDYDKIYSIVNSKRNMFTPNSEIQEQIGRIIVLSDSAHAFGASYKNKMVGSIADFSAFSFHAVKNMTTAEGGALTWNNTIGLDGEEIYQRLQLLSLHGQSKDAYSKNQANSWEYDIIGTWYKCNMTDVHAAIGIAQMKRYDRLLNRRAEIIRMYQDAFDDSKVNCLEHFTSNYSSSGHLYITRVKGINNIKRNSLICKMAEQGVATNVHYKPLPMFTAYKNMGYKIEDYPNAYEFYENEITLPLYSLLKDDEVEYICHVYKSLL